MKSRKRRFAYVGTEHIYKNTKDGGLLFYTLSGRESRWRH